MKKIFSLLAAVFFAGSMMADYSANPVTSVKAGGKYLFERNDRVLIGTISSSKLQTTDEYVTTSLVGDEAYVWTLETAEGGFYLKQGEKYLKNGSGTSVSLVNEGGSVWAFAFTDGVALISNKSNSDRYIGETTAGSNEYKAYSTQNMDYGHDFTVYELVDGEGGGEGGGTGEATELTFEAAGATFDDGGAGFATWTLDLFNNETDYPEVIVTVYAKEVDKIAGTYQASEIKEIALQLSATESGYYFANSPSASTISNISDLQINYMNNGVYKYTMSSFEFNGQTYKFDADLATTGNLHDGSDQGGSGEGGETGDAISLNDVVFCDAWFNMYDAEYGDISTWEFVLYKGYQNNDWVNPYVSLTVYAASESSIVGTYGFGAELQDAWADIDDETEVEAVSGGDLVVTHDSFHHYRFQFTFVADDGETYTIDKVVNTVAFDITNSDEENAPTIELDEDAEETAISNTEATVKAVKTIKDGQLIIERNGVNYNANGQIVR